MGNNFCVCDGDSNKEKESNIFSIISPSNNIPKEEIKTLALENKITQGSNYKTFLDDNTSMNNKLDNFLNEVYKTKNTISQKDEQPIEKENKNNFHCSGKFNISSNYQISNLPNGKDNNINDSQNIQENNEKNINGVNNLRKNELGFISFKSLIVDNNHNIQIKEKIENKDNNLAVSQQTNKSKEFQNNKNKNINQYNINEFNNKKKDENKENGSPLYERNMNYENFKYNDISKYDDTDNEDYLNYESNYTNSNKREENRDEQSLFDDEPNEIS